jgi:hypothetical protein
VAILEEEEEGVTRISFAKRLPKAKFNTENVKKKNPHCGVKESWAPHGKKSR